MGRDVSDHLDDACEQMYGHTNWAYLDTMSKEEAQKLIEEGKITVVAFFNESAPSEDEQMAEAVPFAEPEIQQITYDSRFIADIVDFCREKVKKENLVQDSIEGGGDNWYGFEYKGVVYDLNLYNWFYRDGEGEKDEWLLSIYPMEQLEDGTQQIDTANYLIEGASL